MVASMVMFVLGVVLKQGHMVQRELWTMQRGQLQAAAERETKATEAGTARKSTQRVG